MQRLKRPLQKALVFAALNLPPGVIDGAAATLSSASEKKLDEVAERIVDTIEDSAARELAKLTDSLKDFGPSQNSGEQAPTKQNSQNFTDNPQNDILDNDTKSEAEAARADRPTPSNNRSATTQNTVPEIESEEEIDPTQVGKLSPESETNEDPISSLADKNQTTEDPNDQSPTSSQQGPQSTNPNSEDSTKAEAQQQNVTNQRRSIIASQQQVQQATKTTKAKLAPLQARKTKLVRMKRSVAIPQYILIGVFIFCVITIVLMFTGIPEALAMWSIRLGAKKHRIQALIDTLNKKIKPLLKELEKEEKAAQKNAKAQTMLSRF